MKLSNVVDTVYCLSVEEDYNVVHVIRVLNALCQDMLPTESCQDILSRLRAKT